MIGCLRTRVRMHPIIALYFEYENELKFYNLEAWCAFLMLSTLYLSFTDKALISRLASTPHIISLLNNFSDSNSIFLKKKLDIL